jgi:hypothetical protein
MKQPRDPEALLSAYLAGGMEVLPDRVVDSIVDEIHRTRQRPVFGSWRTRSMIRTVLGAAAVVVLVVGGAVIMIERGQPWIGGPSPTASPSASPSQAAVAVPSATPTATPSPTPLAWSRASLDEDWPAPVRAEPAGGANVVPIFWTDDGETGRYQDPTGDTESDAFPWVDIHAVSFCHNHECPIVWVPGAPNVDPTEQWMAYGLVADDDGDGVADRRFGIDNIPGPVADRGRHRAWITDLHTGQTESSVLNSQETPMVGDTYFRATFPAAPPEEPEQPRMSPCSGVISEPIWMRGLSEALVGLGGGDLTGGGSLGGPLPARFFAWASVIVDGRVAATDYAPDAGWLHPSSKAPPIVGEVASPGPDEVAPPIDSLEEAIAAVVLIDSRLNGFQPSDTHVAGASSWLEAQARGDGWDLTFVCGPETSFAQTTFGDCQADCKRAYAKVHVRRDGTVDGVCEWPEGEEAAGCQ